eukprot:CAMPEP_0119043406 /NCGR_PEP_ID=MMETSP1177-20130426/21597_1 /TAXON_ID=2985 /ORGANISM="Ochromonas sp, Strain CCMP1899" /LENGTH=357 /DNA_ID=CAMNT_0007011415 /DNA_START=193 /DNA_END=1269 /DNA_ORIENTATION=+
MATTSTIETQDANMINPHNFTWQQTMLRIKDPKITVPYYEDNFGFKLIHFYNFPQWSFSLYFLACLPADVKFDCIPGTPESEKYLWSSDHTCLELTHNHGSESDANFCVNNGNVEPYRGFGHLAVMTPDVYSACEELDKKGVRFQKRPDEGRMKGLAFALDPDGYWIEVIRRNAEANHKSTYNFAQTMFRIKDPVKSLTFYKDILGMTLIAESHHSDFSLFFLAHAHQQPLLAEGILKGDLPLPSSPEAKEFMKKMFGPVIELTHNHGTESNVDFKYHNGNDEDKDGMTRGFGHTGFLVDDLDAACAYMEEKGVIFKKKPSEGAMRGLAFAYDPDGYWVEIIQRGGISLASQSTPVV